MEAMIRRVGFGTGSVCFVFLVKIGEKTKEKVKKKKIMCMEKSG